MDWNADLDRGLAKVQDEARLEYTAAVDRIIDATKTEHPYWATADDTSGTPGIDNAFDQFGGEPTVQELRDQAWEYIVLADLIEANAKKDQSGE